MGFEPGFPELTVWCLPLSYHTPLSWINVNWLTNWRLQQWEFVLIASWVSLPWIIPKVNECNMGDGCITFPCNAIKPAHLNPPASVYQQLKPGTHHAIFVFCWTQRRRKDENRMVCAHQRRSSFVDFTNATVVGPIRKSNRSNNCRMVCAGQRHPSHNICIQTNLYCT